jgi:hypothetical protein
MQRVRENVERPRPTEVAARRAPRRWLVATVLIAGLTACGRNDPSQRIEALGSDAAIARMAIAERGTGAVPERYAALLLDAVAERAATEAKQLATAPLDDSTRQRVLAGAREVVRAADAARRDPAQRTPAALRLDSLARALRALAEAARRSGG